MVDSVLRYRSGAVSIADATWSCTGAEHPVLAIEAGSLVFVRSGLLQLSASCSNCCVDANQVLAAPRPQLCVPASAHGSCTIFHFGQGALDSEAAMHGAGASMSSPTLFMRHWHALFWSRSRPDRRELIERATLGLLQEFGTKFVQQTLGDGALVGTIKKELDCNGAAPLALEPLAVKFQMSPFTVSRTFHREVGLSIRHYCKRLRLRNALHLMLESDGDLSAIAIDLGFFDQAHFSNAFRQEFGIPPSLVVTAHRLTKLMSV